MLVRCRVCQIPKEFTDENYVVNGSSDQRRRCKMCRATADRVRYARNAETRKKRLAGNRKYLDAHAESVLAGNRQYRADHSAQENERSRQFRIDNPQLVRAYSSRRKALVRGASTSEVVKREIVWDRDGGVCGICGLNADPNDWHLDHIYPVSKGGTHTYENVQVSHPLCNRRKHTHV